jgi:hypothetical protein
MAHRASSKIRWRRRKSLPEFPKGLVCLTGGQEGVLAQIFAQKRGPSAADTARKHLEGLIGIFGEGNVYAELQRHHRRKEEVRNQAVVELARSLSLKLLATNGVSHAIEAQRKSCVRENPERVGGEAYSGHGLGAYVNEELAAFRRVDLVQFFGDWDEPLLDPSLGLP